MEKKSGFKPGDKIDFSPYLIGEELTFDQLKDMSGQFVVMCDECLPGRDPNGADDLIVVRVLNNGTDSQGAPFIRLEDGDGKAYPYNLYPDEMVVPDEDVDEYTRVWALIRHDDEEEQEGKNMLIFTTKLPPAPAEATTPEYLAAFNLNARIHYCKDSVERGLAEMCMLIEQMHAEKQYKQLGYQNFEDYCKQEFGFERHQGIKYVSVGKMIREQNGNSSYHFEEIGINKLHLLAKLDEPTREAVTEAVDVENATVKELREQISRIESEKADLGQKLDVAKESIDSKTKQFHAALASKDAEIEEVRSGWKRRSDTLLEKIRMLNEQIKELEDRPIEHDVVDHTEDLEALRGELDAANAALADAQKRLAERPMVQDALPVTDTTDAFKAYLSAAADAMRRLLDFVAKRPNDVNHALYLSRIDGVLNLSNTELTKLKGES